MVKRHYVKPCAEIVQVEVESDLMQATTVGFGPDVDDVESGGSMPPGGFVPEGGGETEDVTNEMRSKSLWD